MQPLKTGSMVEISVKLIEVSGQYYECQARHRALVETVKTAP